MKYMRHRWSRYVPFVVSTSLSFPHSWLIIWFAAILTRRVTLVEQELLILPEHLSLPPVLVGFVLLDLYVYVCLSFSTFSFRHCVVRPFLNSGFWLSLWYLQTLLTTILRNGFLDICMAFHIVFFCRHLHHAAISSIVRRSQSAFYTLFLSFESIVQHVAKQIAVVTTNISLLLNGSRCYILRYNDIVYIQFVIVPNIVFYVIHATYFCSKTDRYEITEILLKVALNTTTITINL